MKTSHPALSILLTLALARAAAGEAGVLIPSNLEHPDPKVLSLEEMHLDIRIDNADARVSLRQVFASHHPAVLEGNYLFALPARAAVSDFAVWDGVTRIPGVILERKRAEEIYRELKWQAIDPGLLQMGERSQEEARRTAVFSARIVPIPGFGAKRLEMEYHERIPVEKMQSYFAVPLRPDAYQAQTAAYLTIRFELQSAHALGDFQVAGQTYPLQITERTAHLVRGTLEGRAVTFAEDFAVKYAFQDARTDSLKVLTYRSRRPEPPAPTETSPEPSTEEPGYFQASALFAAGPPPRGSASAGEGDVPGRTVIILFDTSLSMQWEKLERSFRALEALLRSLAPADRFNLLLYNTERTWFREQPVAAEPTTVEAALEFVRQSGLRGGTDLERALSAALGPAGNGGKDRYVVLLGDGNATRGTVHSARLASWYAAKLKALPEGLRPRTYLFAVGDDANLPLLRMLRGETGWLEWVRSTEPIDFKLASFLDKMGRNPLAQLRLTATPAANFDLIYPLEEVVFAGSEGAWVGLYKQPARATEFKVHGVRDGSALELRAKASLPAEDLEHPGLPRTWAKARVDALLAKIERDGEDRATVDEIIRLARKYKFVTPYTSFLAAPRALLRPRVIRPGDPVLRVRTDSSIRSVVALFPFGLIKKLRYLAHEDIWQTRFLAPPHMADGTYPVRLILRDRAGHVYREAKSFVIASQPPVVRVNLEKPKVRRGEALRLRVRASEKTRTIVARMYGVPPVYLAWNHKMGVNTGELFIPPDLPAGPYRIFVTAEDIAHNVGRGEVTVEVLP
jgi:Ca-activated chloride channel family protein